MPGECLTFQKTPLSLCPIARVAQLVEHDLAKVGVASSNLVSRSKSASSGLFCVLEVPFIKSIHRFRPHSQG